MIKNEMMTFFSCLSILGDEILIDLLHKQITTLIIDINEKSTDERRIEHFSVMVYLILELCQRLNKFHFCSLNYRSKKRPIYFSSLDCKSAILTELKVDINCFDECLYLFDGHFPSLSTIVLNVKQIRETSSKRNKTVNWIFFRHEKSSLD